jgi:hypothetical protein
MTDWLTDWLNWTQSQSQSRFSTNSQSASASWCQAYSWAFDQKFVFVWSVVLKIEVLSLLGRPLWWEVLNCVVSLTALRRTQVKTMLATIHVAIVGCHGNPVYRSVAWISTCTNVTRSPKPSSCGRIPWEAPTGPNSILSTVDHLWIFQEGNDQLHLVHYQHHEQSDNYQQCENVKLRDYIQQISRRQKLSQY